MSKLLIDEAVVRQAIDTLEVVWKDHQAIAALRQALEQPAQPLTPDLEADTGYSRDERAAFTAGWEAAEAAHGITKGNT
jgi:hypothetical protein